MSGTLTNAHTSSAKPHAIRNGAASDSSHLMPVVPLSTSTRLSAQNARKQMNCVSVMPSTGSGAVSAATLIHPRAAAIW